MRLKQFLGRTINNKIEYFVTWKSGGNEWVKEEDFQTIEIINDYWKSKDKEEEN